jgi:hypothetical protein
MKSALRRDAQIGAPPRCTEMGVAVPELTGDWEAWQVVLDGVEWGSALHVKALSLVSKEERAPIVDSHSPSFDHLRLVCAPLTANRERLALSDKNDEALAARHAGVPGMCFLQAAPHRLERIPGHHVITLYD